MIASSNETTLLSSFENIYAKLRLRGAAPSTKRHYLYSLRYFDQHLGRPATITDLADDQVGAAMGFIVAADGLGLSPRSANKFRDNVLAIWRFLARIQLRGSGPPKRKPSKSRVGPVKLGLWTPGGDQ